MSYEVLIAAEINEFLQNRSGKTRGIIKENLKKLEENPYPGGGPGDRERLPLKGEKRFRMHIGGTWTAFYSILEDEREIRISEILPIGEAHKKYGY
ncbi:plasmid stabilization protein [candidate division MSBL1 archaeon SCGC-AAA259E19]|uniref:Plasmid stabilization protein n=1 Tax=candidate division MSBL1 archaeon SCGC-AAA259E19 TaxID=1698264 RepID=A0A133UEW2_9EURY|nr:plasmid stabilization protein [candidate division MSBL1 archaeon SCGC-AAA259E19]